MRAISKLLVLLSLEGFGTVIAKSLSYEDNMGDVIFVNVLFRHGARTPKKLYATDPYKDDWPEGLSQLTNDGKRQQYELGQWLRKSYDTLITDKYSPDIIHVKSTDKDRAITSAECNMAGMYPPTEDQIWISGLNWQPIPIHTVPVKLDKVLAAGAPCPAYDKEVEKVLKSQKVKKLYQKYKYIYDILKTNTGENRTDLWFLHNVYDTLSTENQNNLILPEWTKQIFPHPMKEANKEILLSTWTKKRARLRSGLLVQEMIQNIMKKKEGKSKLNIMVYSSHKTTVINFLNALETFDSNIPPYAACLMMELRVTSSGDHLITLFYRTSATEEPRLLTVPGCTALCPLDQFINLTSHVIPEDWDKECQNSD